MSWSSFEYNLWLDAGMPTENYKDSTGNIINPSKDVVFLHLDKILSRPDACFLPKLRGLETLKIDRYIGVVMPFNFSQLENLEFLSITARSDIDSLEYFPSEICHLKKLQDLKISGHRFNIVDRYICLLTNLHTLDLSHNRITKIPESFSLFPHLEKLNLADNISIDIKPILEIDSLRSLDLTDVQIVTGMATKLPAALVSLKYNKFSESFPTSLKALWNERSPEVDYATFQATVIRKLRDEALQIMDEELEKIVAEEN